tara:strand:- start:2826 stop:3674 length:849 start_codon:yes stop_codon:yes gene_type:complete
MDSGKISSLLQDIEERLEDGVAVDETNLAIFLQEMKEVMERFFSESDGYTTKGRMRLSAVGRENRKLWYEYKGYDKPKLNTSTKLRFCFGHVLESLLLLLVREAGHQVADCQKKVTVNGVDGHIDCLIDDELVDVKSASPYGFKKFKDGSITKGEDPFGYMHQLGAYATALGKEKGHFLSIDKSSGELNLLRVNLSKVDTPTRIDFLKETLPLDTPPDRCYAEVEEASGNKKLASGCRFCDFKVECWKDSNNGRGLRRYKYARGPEYFTHVEKEPRVQEDFL